MKHSEAVNAIRMALGRERDLALWPNNTGIAKHTDETTGQTRHVRYGLVNGGSDLVGCLSGRWFCIEVKVKRDPMKPEQILFSNLIQQLGGFACVVRAVSTDDAAAQAWAALTRARNGERQ